MSGRKIRGKFGNLCGPQLEAIRRMLFARQQGDCALCGRPLPPPTKQADPLAPTAATIDHIKPVSIGGLNHPDNWQMAHRGCNEARGNDLLPYADWPERVRMERRGSAVLPYQQADQ